MNTIGIALVWCVVQVTLIGVLAAGLYLVVRRLRPAAAASVAFTGLAIVVVLSLMAASPWPRWTIHQSSPLLSGEGPGVRAIDLDNAPFPTDLTLASGEKQAATASGDEPVTVKSQPSVAALLWQTLSEELAKPQPAVSTNTWHWPAVVAVLFFATMAFGLGWLLLGVLTVRRERLRSRPVLDCELLELVDVLCAELGCLRPVDVRQSDNLATAATVGWRRPLLLLPTDWTTWTADQRRAVLAHEIAHARSHDFLALFFGQLGLVLHFYHPLLHWLMNRLRLEQELAADAAAASVSGGSRQYLTAIAQLALRQQDRPLLWPARSFLPTQTTFLRRIAMLRDSKQRFDRPSPAVRLTTVGAVLLCGLLVAGLRGPSGQSQVLGNDEDAAKVSQTISPAPATASRETEMQIAGACRDERKRPVVGARVMLYLIDHRSRPRSQTHLQTVETDREGKFRFAPVATIHSSRERRDYEVIVTASQKATASVFEISRPGHRPNNLEILMPEAGSLRGKITGPDGRPMEGVQVSAASPLHPPVDGIRAARSNVNGDYEISDLKREDFSKPVPVPGKAGAFHGRVGILYIQHPGFAWTAINYNKVPSTLNVALQPAAVIEGRVIDGETGEPVAGVAVEARGAPLPPSPSPCAVTDSQGRYRLESLNANQYVIWAEKEGWTVHAIEGFSIDVGQTKSVPDLRLIRGQLVVGQVIDDDTGHPIRPWQDEQLRSEYDRPQVCLEICPWRKTFFGTHQFTDVREDGSFQLRVAPGTNWVRLMMPRNWEVLASPPGTLQREIYRINVADGKNANVQFRVKRKPTTTSDRPDQRLQGFERQPSGSLASEKARKAASTNNMKQIALALLFYESTKRGFPPAVLYGPDGKTPHSWRVAVLPYLGEQGLYDQYHFDEPWDGPNNRKLLEKMPAVFRGPNEPAESTNASYFVLTGPDAMFDGKEGTSLGKMFDGTANTIMAVEAMRLLRHSRGNPETEYVEAYPTAPPLDSTSFLALFRFPFFVFRRIAQGCRFERLPWERGQILSL